MMDQGVKTAFLSTPERRAEMLLRQHLSPAQSEDWTTHRSFNVKASSGKVWRVLGTTHSGPYTYTLIDPQNVQRCMYPLSGPSSPMRSFVASLPAADTALSLMLLLMSVPQSRGNWRTTGEQEIDAVACRGMRVTEHFQSWALPQYAPDVREIYERHGERKLIVNSPWVGQYP
jgi:hypothetical protein